MMTEPISRHRISRRELFKLLAAVGVTALGSSLAYTYTPWLSYDQVTTQIRTPYQVQPTLQGRMKELIRYATLAPNGHNAQAWKFLYNDREIQIHPDYSRRLPEVDPQDREMWISLGCALENLLLAARAAGYTPEVTYPDTADFIQVGLAASATQRSPLFEVIPARQVTRSAYDGRPFKTGDLKQLESIPHEPDVTLKFYTDRPGIEMMLEYLNQGNLAQYADAAFKEELTAWLRFNKREALTEMDGLFTRCLGNPEVPRWLGKLFVTRLNPQQQADADAKKFRSSSGAILIASASDSKTAWVRTGQVFERLALTMTSLNVKSALLNQPNEIPVVRSQLQSAAGLGLALPQLLVRFGYADTMPRSMRRPVDQVAVEIAP